MLAPAAANDVGVRLTSGAAKPVAYETFLVIVFTALGLMTVALAAVFIVLLRRNRRLPRLVRRRNGRSGR